jgi:arsenate reductase
MTKVMFLCTRNSCRSQMAEGFAREIGKGVIEPYSAGLSPKGMNERAERIMKEIGIDISKQTSKAVDEKLLKQMDIVITLCDDAAESCPWTPPGIKRLHWPLIDPAAFFGSETDKLQVFRTVRDQIKELVENLIKEVQHG